MLTGDKTDTSREVSEKLKLDECYQATFRRT